MGKGFLNKMQSAIAVKKGNDLYDIEEVTLNKYLVAAGYFPNLRYTKHQAILMPDKIFRKLKISETVFELHFLTATNMQYKFVAEYVKSYKEIPEILCRITTQLEVDVFIKLMAKHNLTSFQYHYLYLICPELNTWPDETTIPMPMLLDVEVPAEIKEYESRGGSIGMTDDEILKLNLKKYYDTIE